MKIILKGRIPSKKNNKSIIFRNGRPSITSSKEYKAWHEEQSWLLPKNQKPLQPNRIVIEFYVPDSRRGDLTNKAESIMDLLVDNKILLDDSWFTVPDIHLKFMGIDRENPRAEIEIFFNF